MSSEQLPVFISLEAALRLQYRAIMLQLPGALHDEEDRAARSESLPLNLILSVSSSLIYFYRYQFMIMVILHTNGDIADQ
jgi:hypothetical protein